MSDATFDFEVLVIGGGPAGLAAACVAAESGRRVGLVDETPWLGGQIWRGQTEAAAPSKAQKWLKRFRRCGAMLLDSTTVIAAPSYGVLLAEHHHESRKLIWQRLILATGARELFLPFPGWTLPGVLGPGGLQSLAKHGWPIAGKRVVVAGSGPLLIAVGAGVRRLGARVAFIAEQAPLGQIAGFGLRMWRYPSKFVQGLQLKLALLGIPYRCGAWPVRAEGEGRVQRVVLTNGARSWPEDCDYLACGFGLVPNTELAAALGCELLDGFVRVDPWQATSVDRVYSAGETTGIGGVDCALVEGQIAGYAAADQRQRAETLFTARATWHRFRGSLKEAFALRPELKDLATPETIVCRCEDVRLGTLRRFHGWREAKLHSRCGMGSCQGRSCGAATKIVLGWEATSVRPPILPARVGSLISSV